jgi:hypothetical protein
VKRHEYLLVCLAEECAEVTHRISKALRFGLKEIQPGQGRTNEQRIYDEIADLYAVLEILEEWGVLKPRAFTETDAAMRAKKIKVEKFMDYSREQGTLE